MSLRKIGKQRYIISGMLFVLLLVAALLVYSGWRSKHALCVTNYELSSDKVSSPIRIVQLTDLHNSTFGENNADLIAAVQEQQPDLIFMTGDMITYPDEDLTIAAHVAQELSKTAPVYFSYGNHEDEYEAEYGADLRQIFTDAGAIVLKDDYIDTTVNGVNVRIGGGYGYGLPDDVVQNEGNADRQAESAFLKAFQATDRYTMLLWHMPVCWMINGSLDYWDIDAVFAGHAHGGQVIFPLIGGLYAPDQGWLPGREWGLFRSEDGTHTLVLSRGLGNSMHIPRINNIPEIVAVDLLPEE